MSGGIVCFWLEPAEFAVEELRRYAGGTSCPSPWGYHNASVVIDPRAPYPLHSDGRTGEGTSDHPRDDTRWPTTCICGYAFSAEDTWQRNLARLYSRSDGGPMTTLRSAPPGAMWDATWWPEKGPDGRCLAVMTPGGEWLIDGPARDGGRWTREGTPPKITASPSIVVGMPERYHGWLRDGVLVPA